MLITCAYQASLRTEEGRPVRFHVLFGVVPEKLAAKLEQIGITKLLVDWDLVTRRSEAGW
jgi:Probable sensor domain DACNV